jgi:hypothetical protein
VETGVDVKTVDEKTVDEKTGNEESRRVVEQVRIAMPPIPSKVPYKLLTNQY